MGIFASVRGGAVRALRGGLHGWGGLGLLLAGLLAPGLAIGQCTVSGGDFVQLQPGGTHQFAFTVGELQIGACTGAQGAISVAGDSTGGASVQPISWTATGPGTQFFDVTVGPTSGGTASIEVTCPDCATPTTLFYTAVTPDEYQLVYRDPPGGLLQAEPGSTVSLQVELLVNGAPADSGEDLVCWEITSNPAGDAVLGPGDTFCETSVPAGGGARAKGTLFGQAVGTYINLEDNGIATVQLQVGSASLSPVEVLVYPQADPAQMLGIQVATVPTLTPVTSSPIAATTGSPFQVAVRMVEITGAGSPGKSIDFSSGDASISPATVTVSTDANGNAVATFTPTQSGSYPDVITARYDPTPTAPGSGDEQVQQFTVNVTDPPPTLSAVTASPVETTTGQAFDLTVQLLDFSGNPVSGATIDFASNDASVTPATTTAVTDTSGNATASFTATQGGSFPNAVTASYDPTPSSPASGDEQSVDFSVNATNPPPSGDLRKPPTGSGDGQAGSPGAVLQITAQAMSDGVPESGVVVEWSVVAGDATVSPAQSTTNAQGLASTSVTLGATTGGVTVRAVRADNPDAVLFYSLNTIDVDQLSIVSGQQQQPQAGAEGEPLVVRFTRNGSPVAGVDVSFQVLSGDATVTPATVATDNGGEAAAGITFGPEGGEVIVQASAGGAQPVTFRFGVPGGSGPPPTGLTLELVSGDGQVGAVGSRAAMPLVVIARDQNGDPLANVPVGWRVLSGSAQLDDVEVLTDAEGRAEVGFRFGNSAGPVVIRASAYSDLAFADFEAEAVVPTLSIVSGDDQQGSAGAPLAEEFVVQVGAASGASLQGVTVTWTVVDGGGSLQTATSETDASGQARNRLTLGDSAGAQHVRATVAGGGQVEFTATALGSGADLEPISGGGQTLPTGSQSEPLVVELRDAAGAPIAGATLVWSGDNATLEQATTVTDAQGRSSNRATVELPGAATVRVEAELDEDVFAVFAINGGVVNTSGLDEDQLEVADAIDNLCPALAAIPNRTPAQQDLLDRCIELADNAGDDPQGVADALDELLQDVSLLQVHAALMITSAQFDNLKARIAAIRSGERGFSIAGLNVAASGGSVPLSLLQDEEPAEVGADFGRWGFFASGTIGRGEADGSGMPRYDYDTSGLTAGVDYRFSDRLIAGAAVGYARQDTELVGDEGEVGTTGFSVSVYSTWFNANSWYMDGVLSWGSSEYELARRIRYTIQRADGSTTSVDQLANADSDGTQLSGALSFGRDFSRGAWSFGPYFRGTWTRVDVDDYAEQLNENLPGSGLAMSVDAREVESMTAVLGGKATYAISRDWGILLPHVSFEWEHEFEDDAQAVVARFLHDPTATPISVSGLPIDSDYYNLGVGLSAVFAGGKSGFVYYEHLLGADGLKHGNLAIGIRIEF